VLDQKLTAKQLLPHFQRCGYGKSHILSDMPLLRGRLAALAGFAQIPFDTRSACFTALDVTTTPDEDAKTCREIGAPLTFLCHQGNLLWWSQTGGDPYQIESVPVNRLEGFFREHADEFHPQKIYRAKTLGRFQQECQLKFVDLGLMPLIEREAGEKIQRLLVDSMLEVRDALGWKQPDFKQGQWLVKAIFWLLGAKMLHDKNVDNFVRLNFGNIEEVFNRVAKHYGDSADGLITSQVKRAALETISKKIDTSPSLQLATTEALAYVYENTLISKEVRAEFGTHSTPSYLVDYIVGRLEPWIQIISEDKRSVFEPGCGQGSFLISATRLLTSLLPPGKAEPAARKKYLRDRVQGYDADDFAVEIARLSLTLTDIPNSNGWMIKQADLFESDALEKAAAKSTILLANPPFEDFKAPQRERYARKFRAPQFHNKTAEMLHRALVAMSTGGVFGVVIPQSLLHESDATDFRKLLVEQFEFQEICLFPDGVFNFADQEAAVLIGQKHQPKSAASVSVRYRRVRERQMESFKSDYSATKESQIAQQCFQKAEDFNLRVPDLEMIWRMLGDLSRLQDFVHIAKGFDHVGKDNPKLPKNTILVSNKKFAGAIRGFVGIGHDLLTHQAPKEKWVSISDDAVQTARSGTVTGKSQVLLNYAPVQRAPWCLKAVSDETGHAVNSRFLVVRPVSNQTSLAALWAFCNSPVANAYAYAHSSKRDILTGTMRDMPIPDLTNLDLSKLNRCVRNYLDAASKHEAAMPLRSDDARNQEQDDLRILHWRMDAEVLRLYALPVILERELLDFFTGWERAGVPFKQDRYFSDGFDEPISLSDYLAITADWAATNARRLELVEKKLCKTIQSEDRAELERLQHLAGLKRELLSSPPMTELRKIEMDLRRRGLWRGV